MPSYSNCRMEEIANAVRGVLALRNGFAENRKLSQHLQKNIAHYDMQITGKVWSELFAKALIPFQLKCSQEEMQQVYMKYSSGQEKVDLKVFCDNFFGVSAFGSALSEPNSLQALDALRLAIQKKVRTENITFMNILKELEGTLDRDSDGFITFDEFVNGFYKCGLPLQPNQWTPSLQRALFSSLDVDGSGTISLFEFQRALRSFAINLRRTLLVKKAFESIAELNPVTNASQVTVHELRERFSVNRHPMVVKNLCTTDDVLKKFLETLGDTNSDGVLTWREFLDYYSDISLTIEFDDYFELMIRNAWHMSGGDGWCENTTCRRILVVASDGSERVVEIQDDIGISKDDLPKIYSKLQEQGIFDISEIAYCM